MTESASTAKRYQDYAATLRRLAKDTVGSENRAYLRSFADNYDNLVKSMEAPATV